MNKAILIDVIIVCCFSQFGNCRVCFCPEKQMFAFTPFIIDDSQASDIFLITQNAEPKIINLGVGNWISKPSFSPQGDSLVFYFQPLNENIIKLNQEKAYRVGLIALNDCTFQTFFEYVSKQDMFFSRYDNGNFAPAWASNSMMCLSIPYGQTKSTINYSLGKIDVNTMEYMSLDHDNATYPLFSNDGKWLFYCEVSQSNSEGLYRDTKFNIVNWENKISYPLDSKIFLYPNDVIFSGNSKVLAIVGKCEHDTNSLPYVDYCIELFENKKDEWKLSNYILFSNLEEIILRYIQIKKHERIDMTISSSFLGLSMNQNGNMFTFLVGVRDTNNMNEIKRSILFVFDIHNEDISVLNVYDLGYIAEGVEIYKDKIFILPEPPEAIFSHYYSTWLELKDINHVEPNSLKKMIKNWNLKVIEEPKLYKKGD